MYRRLFSFSYSTVYEIYGQLVNGVVEEVGFYAVEFQSDVELMNRLVKNQDLRQMMEHLCQDSKYGQSFSKFNGNRIRKDLQQITQQLELKESNLRLFKDWKTKPGSRFTVENQVNLSDWNCQLFESCN